MKLSRFCLWSLFSLLIIVSGCAAQGDGTQAAEKVCVSVRTINSFGSLGDRDIFVTAGTRDHYLFSVIGICPGLRSANAIGVADGLGRICGDGFGRIVFRNPGIGPQSCRVGSIERVTDRAEAKMIVDARR